MGLKNLQKTWFLADGSVHHQPKASGMPSSAVYVCRVCGEVYARVKAFSGDHVYQYHARDMGCCLKCPAYHSAVTPGYIATLSWDDDWPLELWHYHLNLLLDEYDRGQGRIHFFSKQGMTV